MQDKTSFEHPGPQNDSSRARSMAKVAGWAGAFVALVLVGSGSRSVVGIPTGAWAGAVPLPPATIASSHADATPTASPPASASSAHPDAPDRPDAGAAGADAGAGVAADGRIVLNVATEADLQRLPGIGPTKARAILTLRDKLGKFRRVEDLLKVRGIGRRTLARLRPHLALDPP